VSDWLAPIGPERVLEALAINAALALSALALRLVRRSAVVPGIALGAALYLLAGRAGFAVLLGFFVLGTAVTRWGYARKAARGVAEASGGRRGGSHVVANGAVALAAAALARVFPQAGALWAVAYVAAFATALSDTTSSEIGPLSAASPLSLRTGRCVAPGTPGAVSAAGTAAGAAAAAAMAALGWAVGLVDVPGAAAVTVGGFAGNLLESAVTAWSGRRAPGHGLLNAANTLIGALLSVAIVLVARR